MSEQNYPALPPEGHPLRELGKWLTQMLDDDQWPAAERMLLEYHKQFQDAEAEQESQLDSAIKERDEYHEMADKLAARIAEIEQLDIGEHSSGNCPWQNALDGVSQDPD